ncbi:hypothetical protein ACWEQL_36400 [Kitasatospora sp. NPDC004240]
MSDQNPQDPSQKWERPRPLGYSAAVQTMAGTAAPLLAGFSIALIGVVAQAPEAIRWPGTSLLSLITAVTLLVACVQFGFRARTYLYSKAELEEWEPTDDSAEIRFLRTKQQEHYRYWEHWSDLANWCYDLGVVALAAAIAVTVAPPAKYGNDPVTSLEENIRWAGFALAAAAGGAEATWIAWAELRRRRRASAARNRLEARDRPT